MRANSAARVIAALFSTVAAAVADGAPGVESDVRALAAAQAYVGAWRGVGQPKRGSNQGAWTEESQWVWRFAGGRAELVGTLTKDKYYAELRLQAGEQPGRFVLLATPATGDNAGGEPRQFSGQAADDGLVFTADKPRADEPARISLRLTAGGDRLLVLYEKAAGGSYVRLAEVGSTRKGSGFAKASASGPECVVTGGLGKIAVEHKGQTYYVCCTGCRDLFREDPEGVLAEYRVRKAAERAEKNP